MTRNHDAYEYWSVNDDPCEVAYSEALDNIYELAASNNTRSSVQNLVLAPVLNAANTVDLLYKNANLSKPERHRLRAQVTYDLMHRLQTDLELCPEDQITWHETDTPGEEWVEYIASSGEAYGLNPSVRGSRVGAIVSGRKLNKLREHSAEPEPDYDMVKHLFSVEMEDPQKSRRRSLIRRRVGTLALTAMTISFGAGFTMFAIDMKSDRGVQNEKPVDLFKTLRTPTSTLDTTPETTAPVETLLTPTYEEVEITP